MTTGKTRKATFEILAAIVLGVVAVGSFAIQAYTLSSSTTQRETILFSTLQFLLTVGFGWFSTRAVSRGEFENSLKRFAVSAYRRVSDVDRMMSSLQMRVREMRDLRDKDANRDLEVVDAIVADTIHVIHSSIADWADVIGDELLAMEQIKTLQKERTTVAPEEAEAPSGSEQIALAALDERIAKLLNALPAPLQYDSTRATQEAASVASAARLMAKRHAREAGLRLRVRMGTRYKSERAPNSVAVGEQLTTTRYVRPGVGVDAVDKDGRMIGRVLNGGNGPSYSAFGAAIELCYGTPAVQMVVEKIEPAESDEDGRHVHLFCRVVSSSILPADGSA